MMNKLTKGISVEDYEVYAKRKSKGRFEEEENFEIYVRKGSEKSHILFSKVFHGRLPYYMPWIECFSINNQISIDGKVLNYFDSIIEKRLLDYFSTLLANGGRIFIEYFGDGETVHGLNAGFPPPVTRLGFILFQNGFTWFKDWYFPEGLLEGGQKLQGEKPVDKKAKVRQVRFIKKEVKTFLNMMGGEKDLDQYEINAIKRAKNIVRGNKG